jgi:uncharacterized membrane protein
MKKLIVPILLIIMLVVSVQAATLKGTIYNSDLDIETDVLISINTEPVQKFLSKDGIYSLQIPLGEYKLTAIKGFTTTTEEIIISKEGEYIFDLFMLGDFTDEDELWQESEENYFSEEEEQSEKRTWAYIMTGVIAIILIGRFVIARRKYGSLYKFRKKMKVEHKKTLQQHQEDIAQEPGYLEKVLEIIKKHNGRISQKQLRKELLHISEAKVSLILTELEHKNQIEKIKKGRGNVLILK